MESLTARQQQVLDYVAEHLESHGYPPTLREIAHQLGVKGTVSAIHHLEALERKGYLRREPGSSRGIILANRTSQADKASKGCQSTSDLLGTAKTLPIVGTVRAGQPEPAIQDIQGHVLVDPEWVTGDDGFILRVKGDSMIEAGIFDGDLAIVHPQQTAENGQIVVAMVDGEATLKRYFREADHIRLQPENRTLEPIIIREGEGEAVIVGRLVKSIRFF